MRRSEDRRLPLPRNLRQKETQSSGQWWVKKGLWFINENQVEIGAEYCRKDSGICLNPIARLLHSACAGVKRQGFVAEGAFDLRPRWKGVRKAKLEMSKIRGIDQDVKPQ